MTRIYHNGKIATNSEQGFVEALAVEDGKVAAVGSAKDVVGLYPHVEMVDLQGRTAIPGLNDSHIHLIRGGLRYNMELRWDGVPSLADALRMLKEQVARTPAPQWVQVVGGWSEYQFAERRMPTLGEINAVSKDTPVFILHLYDRALLNGAALRAVGITKDTPNPPGGEIQRDRYGNATGMLIAKPNASILYGALAKSPQLSPEDQMISTRHFMREMNRFGVTSLIDAGGGSQRYPEDYTVIEELHNRGLMTVRIAYNLFTQHPGQELKDYQTWTESLTLYEGDQILKLNGAGENLVYSAADYEDFLQLRPDLGPTMESDLEAVIRVLAAKKWPFRIHSTYDQSIDRFLNVIERVNRDIPVKDLRWFLDHAETISDRNMERLAGMGGGIAIQHRMAFQGEYFLKSYGQEAARRAPPIRQMLQMGIPVGAGTDATRVATYNPFVCLQWLVTGKTVGGTTLNKPEDRLSREEALKLYTSGSTWFSAENGLKGQLIPGQFADIAVLSDDYFSVEEDRISSLESVLTILGGEIVYAEEEFRHLGPGMLPCAPDWTPGAHYKGYDRRPYEPVGTARVVHANESDTCCSSQTSMLWPLGCDCFAF